MISLSLQPSPASETSAFNKISAFIRRRGNRGRFPCRLDCGEPDEERQAWDGGGAGNGEAASVEAIERHLELGAGLGEAEHGVAGGLCCVPCGPAADFALGSP